MVVVRLREVAEQHVLHQINKKMHVSPKRSQSTGMCYDFGRHRESIVKEEKAQTGMSAASVGPKHASSPDRERSSPLS